MKQNLHVSIVETRGMNKGPKKCAKSLTEKAMTILNIVFYLYILS